MKMAWICALLVATPAFTSTPDELRTAVEAKFTVTTRNRMGNVVQPGAILVLQQDGLRADKPKLVLRPAEVRNGRLTNVGGGGFVGNTGATLRKGDKLHLYSVKVRKEDVILIVATTETYQVVENGETRSMPYETAIAFAYDGGPASISPDQLLSDIDAWFKTEAESSAANVKTVALGQSLDEVLAILGQPEKKIELGSRVTFVYPDMKVIFTDGKVSDVQ